MSHKVAIEYDSADQAGYLPQVQDLLADMGLQSQLVSSPDIMAGILNDGFCSITFPGGLGAFMGLRSYGDKFAKCIQFYVASGINYLGMCGGAYVAGVKLPYFATVYARNSLRLIDAEMETPSLFSMLEQYQQMQEERILVSCDLSQESHPINHGHEGEREDLVYSGGPIITHCGPSVQRLAYFYNEALSAERGEVALAASQFGRGRVVVCSPHPEAPKERGVDIGEPCLKWLYQRMVEYVLEPETFVLFPMFPWEKAAAMPTPILPLMGMAAIGGIVIAGRGKAARG